MPQQMCARRRLFSNLVVAKELPALLTTFLEDDSVLAIESI